MCIKALILILFSALILTFYLFRVPVAEAENYCTTNEFFRDLVEFYEIDKKPAQELLNILAEKRPFIKKCDNELEEQVNKFLKLKNHILKISSESILILKAKERLSEGKFKEAEKHLIQSFNENLTGPGSNKRQAAFEAYALGALKELNFEYNEACRYFEKAVELAPLNLHFLNSFAKALYRVGDYKKAIPCYEKALLITQDTYGAIHPKVANCLNYLAASWENSGDYRKAIFLYKQALEIEINLNGDQTIFVADYWEKIGDSWRALGNYEEAISLYRRAQSLYEKLLGPGKSPRKAGVLNKLGLAWQSKGEFWKAISLYGQALDINGEQHPAAADILNNLGSAWLYYGDKDKALSFFKRALELDQRFYPEQDPKVAIHLNNLGSAFQFLGKYSDAISQYEKALNIEQKFYEKDHPFIAIDLTNLGFAWQCYGDENRAISYYETAERIFQNKLGDDHHYTLKLNHLLTDIKSGQGKDPCSVRPIK